VEEHDRLRRLKVASADPAKTAVCSELERIQIERDRPYLARIAVKAKEPLVIADFGAAELESVAQGAEHLKLLRALGPRSLMAVPLLRREQLLGTMTFVSSAVGRAYGTSDLRLARALADRAVVAIENAQLYRTAVQASKLRDRVLGVVAHDLRNPLSTILLHVAVSTCRAGQPERRDQRANEIVARAARRMKRLIQDLLDVAQVEAEGLRVQRAAVPAKDLLVEAIDLQGSLAASAELTMQIEVEAEVPEVWGDRDRLLQVFENLIGNAIKFTKPGGQITVGATTLDEEILFWVRDTGCGIAPENMPHVFDRFWQVAQHAGRLGAGLGLPITKGIVEAHGGRLWVESVQNQGSTFFFTIPRFGQAADRPSSTLH
jgi:signal transduction histidine kinase